MTKAKKKTRVFKAFKVLELSKMPKVFILFKHRPCLLPKRKCDYGAVFLSSSVQLQKEHLLNGRLVISSCFATA